MSEWQTMEAGPQLDRLIAERLGYHVEFRTWDHNGESERYGALITADGKEEVTAWDLEREDPELVWEHALSHNPECGGYWDLPSWSWNLNAAFTLVSEMVDQFRVGLADMGWKAEVVIWSNDKSPNTQYADTPSLAICKAWLAYQDAKDTAS